MTQKAFLRTKKAQTSKII